MTEQVNSLGGKKDRKLQHVLWILGSFIWYALSLVEPSVRVPMLGYQDRSPDHNP